MGNHIGYKTAPPVTRGCAFSPAVSKGRGLLERKSFFLRFVKTLSLERPLTPTLSPEGRGG